LAKSREPPAPLSEVHAVPVAAEGSGPTVTAIQAGARNVAGEFVSDTVKEAGANLKYGINSNLTFDFTYNPDFSQIESDRQQIEVNQRFPISYPELRPFFLEGQEIFRVPGPITFMWTAQPGACAGLVGGCRRQGGSYD